MKPAHIHDAIHKASHETSRIASAHLRQEAAMSGWPEHIVNNMHVSYDKDGFGVHVHERHHAEALDQEYGVPGRQPNAAMRRSIHNTSQSEDFFVNRLYKHLEDSL